MKDARKRDRDFQVFNEALDYMADGADCSDASLVGLVRAIMEAQAENLAAAFYRDLMNIPSARFFLKNGIVEKRLHRSMTTWLIDLFAACDREDLKAHLLRQTQIGLVHSRINVPVMLVKKASLILKKHIFEALSREIRDPARLIAAYRFADEILELSVSFINLSYVTERLSGEQALQSFRLENTSRYTAIECERVRSSLFDWLRGFFAALFSRDPRQAKNVIPPAQADFGLWISHKAGVIFSDQADDTAALSAALSEMAALSEEAARIIGEKKSEGRVSEIINRMNGLAGSLSFTLSSFVSTLLEAEAGKDQLTQVYNRKYLPIVLKHAVKTSIETGERFAVAIADLDHFKAVNDAHGHNLGDAVLAKVSDILVSNTRMGDTVFRYGGEEFLLLLSGVDERAAVLTAEKLRLLISRSPVEISEGRMLTVTASFGVALHDGHPDYSRIITRADEALYRAKSGGRNRVALAENGGNAGNAG